MKTDTKLSLNYRRFFYIILAFQHQVNGHHYDKGCLFCPCS